ncbi:RNA polymerase sigma factor SigZ [Paraferrimonas haliotis]|uniref:RNA polymerase sigma factor SigZ n=1 Tax=Paraferrimonas haliotis TaxID=2013866 RepID=UPI000BA9A9F0|nr:RNA polymerase sigma factor SigZ [Paraferrimonas haliotis]
MTEKTLSFEQVWNEYRQSLWAFLNSKVNNHADADDLLQDILLKSYDKLSSLEDITRLKPWLFQIANHTLVDYYRRQKNLHHTDDVELIAQLDEPSITHELSRCIGTFLKGLPEESAQLLQAIDIEGVSQKAYAQQHGIPYSTLKSRVQTSRQQLKRLYERCCQYDLDSRGRLMDFHPRNNSCKNC